MAVFLAISAMLEGVLAKPWQHDSLIHIWNKHVCYGGRDWQLLYPDHSS